MAQVVDVPSLPVWAVKSFDGLGIKIFYRLFVRSTDSVFGACISIKSIDSFGDAHLGGCHGCTDVRSAICHRNRCRSPRRESK